MAEAEINSAIPGRKSEYAMKPEDVDPQVDMELDAGIREYVLALREGGIETFESCEGGEGHPFPQPTIRFHGTSGEGFRALAVAKERGLPISCIRMSYPVIDGWPTGPWWEMVFTTKSQN